MSALGPAAAGRTEEAVQDDTQHLMAGEPPAAFGEHGWGGWQRPGVLQACGHIERSPGPAPPVVIHRLGLETCRREARLSAVPTTTPGGWGVRGPLRVPSGSLGVQGHRHLSAASSHGAACAGCWSGGSSCAALLGHGAGGPSGTWWSWGVRRCLLLLWPPAPTEPRRDAA